MQFHLSIITYIVSHIMYYVLMGSGIEKARKHSLRALFYIAWSHGESNSDFQDENLAS